MENNKEQHYLYPNTIALASSVAQTILDMAGADYRVNEDSFQKGKYEFPHMIHASIRFYSMIQGEYIISLEEETAAKLAQVYEDGMSADELKEHREEYGGFVSELLNAAVGHAVQELRKTFEDPTIIPVRITYGEMIYPDIPSGCVELKGHAGPVVCSFILNLMSLKIGESLQNARDEIQSKDRETEQLRENIRQVMGVLPELNKTVDEFFIIQNLIYQDPNIQSAINKGLGKYFEQLSRVSSKIRSILMTLWATPLQQTFEKIRLLVEQASIKYRKTIQLSMSGGETEIDRQMDDVIFEAMTHLIRNAVQYGIEPSEERIKAGKPEDGAIQLRGSVKSGNIVIEVQDDGRGLNRTLIINKAKKLGIIDSDELLSGYEADQLIFCQDSSSVSKHFTGLGKVKNIIEKLKGSVEVKSSPGKGTDFIIKLPVAMSVAEGIIASINSQHYIIPITNIRETLRPEKQDYYTVEGKGEMIRLRGTLLPLIRLDKLFSMVEYEVNPWEAMVIVVENEGEFACILADEIVGKQEVAVQNLGKEYWIRSDCIVGASIMANGRVSLVLDIRSIFMLHKN
ncbi:MAG: hypothetical protein GY795_18095 [Desulfobacterales bacterium]|nr:hypothetical protein [Desulfobacterales bacterium]